MAKRTASAADALDNHGTGHSQLPHSGQLRTTAYSLSKGTVLHRVHHEHYSADQFNPGVRGNARFSPIRNAEGDPIPTLYAGVTKACAMMETIFHDVSIAIRRLANGLKKFMHSAR